MLVRLVDALVLTAKSRESQGQILSGPLVLRATYAANGPSAFHPEISEKKGESLEKVNLVPVSPFFA